MNSDNRCTICLQWGHKAHNCPNAPWRTRSLALTLALAMVATGASACKDTLRWQKDKAEHLAASAAIAAAVGTATKNPELGFWVSFGAGVLKEAYDAKHRDKHCPSAADLAYDAAGAWLGMQAAGWMIRPSADGLSITYSTTF